MILRILLYMITFRDSDWLRAVRLMQTLQLSVISANLCYVKLQGVDAHCNHVRCKCIPQIFLYTLLISNSIIAHEIWKKTRTPVFFKDHKLHSSFGRAILRSFKNSLVCGFFPKLYSKSGYYLYKFDSMLHTTRKSKKCF